MIYTVYYTVDEIGMDINVIISNDLLLAKPFSISNSCLDIVCLIFNFELVKGFIYPINTIYKWTIEYILSDEQAGFRRGCNTVEQIVNRRMIVEKHIGIQKKTLFITSLILKRHSIVYGT